MGTVDVGMNFNALQPGLEFQVKKKNKDRELNN